VKFLQIELLKKQSGFKFSPCIFLERDSCLQEVTNIIANRVGQVPQNRRLQCDDVKLWGYISPNQRTKKLHSCSKC